MWCSRVAASGFYPEAMTLPAGTTTPRLFSELQLGVLSFLPPELRLHVLSLLPPNDLALGGRLSCKDAAQRFSETHHRTAHLRQPLPSHVATGEAPTANLCVEAAQTALRELTLRRKLLLISTAAASGCEANVEFAWQLLQPHVFPELLQTDRYLPSLTRCRTGRRVPDVGSAAVASGLAHLLPSLAQRCPGLLDPGPTLEAAARHCDLAGLQAAWEVLGQHILSTLARLDAVGNSGQGGGTNPQQQEAQKAHGVWRRMLSAAAGSARPDAAEANMEWVLDKGRAHSRLAVEHVEVWGAAAASGDLTRLQWLRERGFPWGGIDALAAVVRHADLGFIVRMEREGGYLPHAGDECWGSEMMVCAAAGSARDSAPKLQWLAARGAALGRAVALQAAAARGDLGAVQLLMGHWRGPSPDEAEQQPGGGLPPQVMLAAVQSGSVCTASWLLQQGGVLESVHFSAAFARGNLAMVRWLLQAGCPRGSPFGINQAVGVWPSNTSGDMEGLVASVQLLAEAGWPREAGDPLDSFSTAALWHPWAVWRALLGMSGEPAAVQVPGHALILAAHAGCEATLEAMVQLRVSEAYFEGHWYFGATIGCDRGTLTRLLRLGVPLQGELLVWAARGSAPLLVLQWLVEQGIPCCGEVVRAALGALGEASPARRGEQERREVEAWLRGLLPRAEQQGQGPAAGAGERRGAEPGAGEEGSGGQSASLGVEGSTAARGCPIGGGWPAGPRGGKGKGLGWLWRCCVRGTGTAS